MTPAGGISLIPHRCNSESVAAVGAEWRLPGDPMLRRVNVERALTNTGVGIGITPHATPALLHERTGPAGCVNGLARG
jgi:hypothetical protein